MLSRICYSLSIFWRYRTQLKSYVRNPQLQLATITLLNVAALKKANIKALALDFDGVLASHAEPMPRPEVIEWLQDLQQKFVPHKIYILSNKPTLQRQSYFAENFAAIEFVVAKRKKPYPDGLQQIMYESGVLPSQLLLVDDRLGTGIAAAASCGVQAYWLTKPYIDLRARPFKELFFISLRLLERVSCKII